ncbi:MAG: ParB/RepB/Spo0J family partition protein [Methylophilaceae bacterium]|nr:ParB/RepB/Spo0J family partition protein [Methyloradius sp.]
MDTQSSTLPVNLPVHLVWPSPTNPRKRFNEDHVNGIAETMKTVGVLQAIVVRKFKGRPNNFEIVAGETRWRAAKVAGLKEIPASVRELSDSEVIKIQVIENLQRADLHPLEEAAGFKALLDNSQDLVEYSVDNLADEIGKSRTYVYDSLKLLELEDESVKLFYDGKLTRSSALLLARLEPEDHASVRTFITANTDPSYREIKAQAEIVVNKSNERKKLQIELEKAYALAFDMTTIDGKKTVVLDPSDTALYKEWAPYGEQGLCYNGWAKDGYVTQDATYYISNDYEQYTVKDILDEAEYVDSVYIITKDCKVVIVMHKAKTWAWIQQRRDNGSFVPQKRKPTPPTERIVLQEAEGKRRLKVATAICNTLHNNQALDRDAILNLVLSEAIQIVYGNSSYNANAELKKLMEIDKDIDITDYLSKARSIDENINLLTVALTTDGIGPEYNWQEEDADEEEYARLRAIAQLVGVDPDSADAKPALTPLPAAQPTNTTETKIDVAVAESLGELSNEESGDQIMSAAPALSSKPLPPGFAKAKEKALKKQAKTVMTVSHQTSTGSVTKTRSNGQTITTHTMK